MKVRAIAVREARSNAIGTVELECTAFGINLVHLGVSPVSEGYVPGTPTQHTSLLIPWANVQSAQIEGDQLYLAIDPGLSPLNRLVLRNFSAHEALDHHELYRRRLIVRVALVATLLIAVLLSWVVAARASEDRPALLALVVATFAASLILALGIAADRWLLGGSAAALRDRALFFGELSLYLPHLGQRQSRPVQRPQALAWVSARLVPRSTTAVVIALSASSLAALLTGKWLFEQRRGEVATTPPMGAAPTQLEPAVVAAVQAPEPSPAPARAPAVPAPQATNPTSPGGPCSCQRSESILWRTALPRLSPVLIEQRVRPHNDHTHLDLELGIVNNSNQALRELTLNLQFYEDAKGKKKAREATKGQPLYFEGPLRPGQAIKWSVEGRGTSFEVDNPHHETLNPSGSDAAPVDTFDELLSSANHRPIRLHGAMMLAALGEVERARAGALALKEALREEEAPYLERVLSATGPIAICQLAVSDIGAVRQVQACAFNRGAVPKPNTALRVRALDRVFDHRNPIAPPPIVIAEEFHRVGFAIAPNTGHTFSALLDTTNPDELQPETFEVLLDESEN